MLPCRAIWPSIFTAVSLLGSFVRSVVIRKHCCIAAYFAFVTKTDWLGEFGVGESGVGVEVAGLEAVAVALDVGDDFQGRRGNVFYLHCLGAEVHRKLCFCGI